MTEDLRQYTAVNRKRFEEELGEFVSIPSVSAGSGNIADMEHATTWTQNQLQEIGFHTELIPTSGFPLVYAESPTIKGLPTCLVYGHYDVQPADPLDEWISPPFVPTWRDGYLFGRGASDDKGQIFSHIKSAEAWMQTAGSLPVNLKFLIEGEEEVGSCGLSAFLENSTGKLACDYLVVSDGSQFAPGVPAITYGLRGVMYFELRLHGPNRDLHSGSFGGCVANPANVLAALLTGIKDPSGRIRLSGFYDDVLPMTEKERHAIAALPFDSKQFLLSLGVENGYGEEGYTLLEQRWARPTFDICGIWGGYQGEGRKTVLPASAGAKISFRLVPQQDPEKIAASLRQYLAQEMPPGIRWELLDLQSAPSVVASQESPVARAATAAIQEVFGCSPVFVREGASVPIVAAFQRKLGAEPLLLGWGQSSDNTHGPNECFSMADYHRAILANGYLWKYIANANSETY